MLWPITTTWPLSLCMCLASSAFGQTKWVSPTETWDTIGPPTGTLLIHGGTHGGRGADAFISLVNDPEALIVVIPTAGPDANCGENAPAVAPLRERGAKNVKVLHTRDRKTANSVDFVAPLRQARAVWISGGQQSRLATAYLHTLTHRELFGILQRGGVVAGNSAGASIQGSFLYGGHNGGDVGFGFVRQSAIGQHYIRRHRMGGLARIVSQSPGLLGIGIDEDTFIILRGDTFEVSGTSKVALCDARRPGWSVGQPYEFLFAGDRYDLKNRRTLTQHPWDPAGQWNGADKTWQDPAANWKTCGPPEGTLLMCGAQAGPAIMQRFLDLLGDREAHIVVIPTPGADNPGQRNQPLDTLRKMGARNATLWHTNDRNAANSTRFVTPLRNARGVWICTGEQWRLADAFLHTLAHKELFDLLDRGGVIAAEGGAARFLASRMAGDAYGWNEGGGFLRASTVHTWPTENRAIADVVAILKKENSLLGIGIDHAAAIVVQGNEFEVIGDGKVAVFDATRRGWPWEDDESHILLDTGEHYDMRTRRPNW
ncbi:MAG: Type 1 glutamine amidotransferase-like domain-containing protein [Phycisphaerae bacterium]|nr:Type 1 glutamine amidotransferase-like domain-containing protein [Phycisphaerae bacterium]